MKTFTKPGSKVPENEIEEKNAEGSSPPETNVQLIFCLIINFDKNTNYFINPHLMFNIELHSNFMCFNDHDHLY